MPLATWQGPYDAMLPDKSILRIGDEYEVGEIELRSAHWKRVRHAKADTPTPSASSTEKADS